MENGDQNVEIFQHIKFNDYCWGSDEKN